VASYFTAFPDLHLTIEDVLAVGDQLLARLSATGTHEGQFLGVVATGNRVTVSAFEAWRLREAQCAEHLLHLGPTQPAAPVRGRPGGPRRACRGERF
jgi:predicted ester cyclase